VAEKVAVAPGSPDWLRQVVFLKKQILNVAHQYMSDDFNGQMAPDTTQVGRPGSVTTGYMHPGYAQSLSEFGTPTELKQSRAWFLRRGIPSSAYFDGMSCYPYLACQDWSMLASDLEAQRQDLVSFVATPDPFGSYTLADLERAFPKGVFPFKEHHVADLGRRRDEIVSRRDRKHAEKALRQLDIEFEPHPLRLLDVWTSLFELTVKKFGINGIRAYSRAAFAQQLALPGALMSLACLQGEAVAAHIWMVHGDAAYAHLAAATDIARKIGASYALYYAELGYFGDKVRWIDWGGESGLAKDGSLSSFKRGWSTHRRPVYFCSRIFNCELYDQIVHAKGVRSTSYVPAYRVGEFN
jgi:Acetyltransferase (GNAT) domain